MTSVVVYSYGGFVDAFIGKPNPDCFPFSGMSIMVKDTSEQIQLDDKDLHDAFQYALIPGGMTELRQVRMERCPSSIIAWHLFFSPSVRLL